ncbi:MAG: CBS domain-containing protein [Candidatus Moduliflexus flocculans]|nr:CBS domain-containing protein [Candidatus Moduliflexus flocculans]
MKLQDLAREVDIVPENKPISDLLNDFTRNKTQMAVVVDEHGGVAGIVTVEDILEELLAKFGMNMMFIFLMLLKLTIIHLRLTPKWIFTT